MEMVTITFSDWTVQQASFSSWGRSFACLFIYKAIISSTWARKHDYWYTRSLVSVYTFILIFFHFQNGYSELKLILLFFHSIFTPPDEQNKQIKRGILSTKMENSKTRNVEYYFHGSWFFLFKLHKSSCCGFTSPQSKKKKRGKSNEKCSHEKFYCLSNL